MVNIKYKKISKAGSITIPVDVRRELELQPGDGMEIEVTEDNRIVVQPYQLRCTFCGSTEDVAKFHAKGICKRCEEQLKR